MNEVTFSRARTSFEMLVIDKVCSAGKNLSIRPGIYINFVGVLSQAEFYSVSYRCAGSYWKESGDLLLHSCSNVPRVEYEGRN